MRTKFLISFLLSALVVWSASAQPQVVSVILTANSESQIKEWAKDKGTSSRVLKFKGGGKDVIVLLIDTASGNTRENIYVFYFERDEWHLCLLRLTNGAVDVENSGKALIFKNSKGTILVEQPFISMKYLLDGE